MTAQPPEQQPGQGEADRIQSLDQRFGKIEQEQTEQRGLLEQIRDAVAGTGPARPAHDKAQAHTEQRLEQPPAAAMADQVRQAVKDVNAEEEQRKRQADHDADHDRIRELAERAPRESQSGWRAKLQRGMFGSDPK